MRRAPSCLLFAILVLCFGPAVSEAAFAEAGVRHGMHARHGGWTGRPAITARGQRTNFRRLTLDRPRHVHPLRFHRKHRHGFFPHRSWAWPYVEATGEATPLILESGEPPAPQRVFTGIPSLADLPVSTGIRSEPPASPAIYVLNGNRRSHRRGSAGAKILSMDSADVDSQSKNSGPRIIHLNVPQGR